MIRKMQPTDVKGINKLPPAEWLFDYELFLQDFLGEEYFYAFVLEKEGKIIGTGNVFLKNQVGWLANIIVDQKYRCQGFGLQITQFLIDFLKQRDCRTQFLIATELGEAVYSKCGFQRICEYWSFDSQVECELGILPQIRPLEESHFAKVCLLDAEINGEDRSHLLGKYFEDGFGYFAEEELLGFYLPKFGRGLVISKDPEAGCELLKVKHSQLGKRSLLPIKNDKALKFMQKLGLKHTGKAAKMYLGEKRDWKPKGIYSYGSGFCG